MALKTNADYRISSFNNKQELDLESLINGFYNIFLDEHLGDLDYRPPGQELTVREKILYKARQFGNLVHEYVRSGSIVVEESNSKNKIDLDSRFNTDLDESEVIFENRKTHSVINLRSKRADNISSAFNPKPQQFILKLR